MKLQKIKYCFLLCCLLACMQLRGQQLSKLEYFFDTDPGLGKGVSITVNKTSIDTNLVINLSSVTEGLHTFFLRAIDTAGKWSITNAAGFVKYPGTDTVLNIDRIEYFFDTDPGLGKGIPITITPGNTISNLFNIVVPDNGTNSTTFHLRVRDSYGRWSLQFDTTYNLCQLYKTVANFDYIRYGSTYSLLDSSRNNPKHKLTWVFDDGGANDTTINPVRQLSIGRHFVKLVTGVGCKADSITKGLFTGVEGYNPTTIIGAADYTVDVYGAGFDTSCSATLNDGATIIKPYQKRIIDNSHAVFLFDFHKLVNTGNARFLDLAVHFPKSSYDTTVKNAIKFKSPSGFGFFDSSLIRPLLSVSIDEPGRTGANTWHYGSFTIQNNGYEQQGVELVGSIGGGAALRYTGIWYPMPGTVGPIAKLVPFVFTFDNQLQSFELLNTRIVNYIDKNSRVPASRFDSIPLFDFVDSVRGDAYQGKIYQILIPEIKPGESVTINFRYLTPASLKNELKTYYWIGHNLLGSPIDASKANCLANCISTMAGVASYFPPFEVAAFVAGCGSSIAQNLWGALTGDGSLTSIGSAVANMTWGCIVTAPGAKEVINSAKLFSAVTGVNALNNASSYYSALKSCIDCFLPGNLWTTWNFASSDPNQIVGPSGSDTLYRYVNLGDRMPYRVEFENKANAARSAQSVTVIDTFSRKYDLSSLQLTNFQIGDSVFTIPSFRNQYTATIDLTKKQKVLVRFNAKLDTSTRTLTCTFTSIDPVTKQVITDTSLAGFLPPDKDSLSGRGSISFHILQDTLNSNLDTMVNRASIVFDNNAPILTNSWKNTLDNRSPVSGIDSVRIIADTIFRVYYSPKDAESGYKVNYLYGSVNGAPYVAQGTSSRNFIDVRGSKDSVYDLITIPYDYVNNRSTKTQSEAHFTLFNLAPITGDTSLCVGAKMKYADTTSGGVWSSSDNSVATVDASGNLTAIKTGIVTLNYAVTRGGISGTATRRISIGTLPAKPTITKDANNNMVSSATSGNQWYIDTTTVIAGATAQTYKPAAAGLYSVRVINNGCPGPYSDKYAYVLTAIVNVGGGNYISIAPNPATGFIVVHHNLTANPYLSLELYSIEGKRLLTRSRAKDGEQINITALPAGLYVVKLYNDGGKVLGTTKLVKL